MRPDPSVLPWLSLKSLQKFVSIHSSIHNHFDQERHLYSRQNFKLNLTAALTEWWRLCFA
jgi:putative transposase